MEIMIRDYSYTLKIKHYLFFIIAIISACKKSNDIQPLNLGIPESSLTNLNYPHDSGSSGDISTSVLGYGYDIVGFCDTVSIRAKIFNLDLNNIYIDQLWWSYPLFDAKENFTALIEDLSNIDLQAEEVRSANIQALWKLAFKTDSVDSRYAFAYYTFIWISPRYRIGPTSDFKSLLSDEFKNDLEIFTAKDLIAKYGTHVLKYVVLGRKIDILYGIRSSNKNSLSADQIKDCFFYRLNQFFGGCLGINYSSSQMGAYNTNDEFIIFNTIGCDTKQCGLLVPTDNNPNEIAIDIYSSFNSSNKFQFTYIDQNGLIPIYDLIGDPAKRTEVKDYVENYISTNLNMHVY